MRKGPVRRMVLKRYYAVPVCSFILLLLMFIPAMYVYRPFTATGPAQSQPSNPVFPHQTCRDFFSDPNGAHDSPSTSSLEQHLRDVGLSLPRSPSCSSTALNLSHPHKLLIAANLHNSMHILPHMALQLLRYTTAAAHGDVFVSIYASGSSDTTPEYLAALDNVLTACGVPHQVTPSGNVIRATGEGRIPFLARVRNAALQPLASGTFAPRRVAFINDVYFCAEDIDRLAALDADIACGMDFEPILADLPRVDKRQAMASHLTASWRMPRAAAVALARSTAAFKLWRRAYGRTDSALDKLPLLFYDTWVARDVAGARVTRRAPYIMHLPSRERLRSGLPVPVQCCWNGLVVLAAAPFVAGLRFRAHGEGECAASECSLLCDDFWRAGHRHFVMDPRVRVAYRELAARKLHSAAVEGLPAAKPLAAPFVAPWNQWAAINPDGRVECCPIQPGKNTVDFNKGCFMSSRAANSSVTGPPPL